jgi:hypothetical protein
VDHAREVPELLEANERIPAQCLVMRDSALSNGRQQGLALDAQELVLGALAQQPTLHQLHRHRATRNRRIATRVLGHGSSLSQLAKVVSSTRYVTATLRMLAGTVEHGDGAT